MDIYPGQAAVAVAYILAADEQLMRRRIWISKHFANLLLNSSLKWCIDIG